VHGLAAGGAFYWINEADIVICSEDAQFFDPHTTFGLVPSNEPIGLARMVHPREALRIALMGNDERVSAQTALRIGLVSEITTRAELWPRAHEIAARIAAKPSVATQGAVRAIWESLDEGRQAALDHGIIYNRIGNPIGEPQVDRWNLPKIPWRLR
jgi:enoyl-CoA hydratase/carnithine racemase